MDGRTIGTRHYSAVDLNLSECQILRNDAPNHKHRAGHLGSPGSPEHHAQSQRRRPPSCCLSVLSFRFESHRNMMGVIRSRTFQLHTSVSYRSPWTRFALGASRLQERAAAIAKFPAPVVDNFPLCDGLWGQRKGKVRTSSSREKVLQLQTFYAFDADSTSQRLMLPAVAGVLRDAVFDLACAGPRLADLHGSGKHDF